jgi:hypothetical protein
MARAEAAPARVPARSEGGGVKGDLRVYRLRAPSPRCSCGNATAARTSPGRPGHSVANHYAGVLERSRKSRESAPLTRSETPARRSDVREICAAAHRRRCREPRTPCNCRGGRYSTSSSSQAHLTASARFRALAPGLVSGRLSTTTRLKNRPIGRGFPLPFGHRHRFSVILFPPRDRLSSRSAHRPTRAGARRGYRVPHARAATGGGRPL